MWCSKGDGLSIGKLEFDEKHFELEIYGGTDMEMMEELIFNVSYHWGVKSYLELQSTTRASGLNFRWINEGEALQYYDDQSENYKELNLNNGLEYCFEYVEELLKQGKIEASEIELKPLNELDLLDDLSLQPDFLERIGVWNRKWEIEQEKNRQRLLNWKKDKSKTNSAKSLSEGISALFEIRDEEERRE